MSLILVPFYIIIIINVYDVLRNNDSIALHLNGHPIIIFIIIVDLIIVIEIEFFEIFEVRISLSMSWQILLLIKSRKLISTPYSTCLIINYEISSLESCLIVVLCQGLLEFWIESCVGISPFKDIVISVFYLS